MNLPRIARVECDGFDYSVFATDDFLSQQVFRNGTWGKLQHALTEVFLKGFESPIVIDVGANIFANRLDCVWAFHQAVGAAPGKVDLPSFDYSKVENVGAFSLDAGLRKLRGQEAGLDSSRPESVAVTTLDQLDAGGRVRCVKVDVEGLEIDVIRGGRTFLAQHRFPPLIFEAWEGEWFNAQRKALFAEIESLGYTVAKLARDEFVAQHPDYEAAVEVKVDGNRINLTRTR